MNCSEKKILLKLIRKRLGGRMYEEFIKEANLNPENFGGAWSFGNNPPMADEILDLVLQGKKRATASALLDYNPDEDLPEVDGKYELLLDGKGCPRVAIQTSKVYITKFNEVTKEHAFKEGEGDRSLAYWRQAHENFFREIGCFSPDMDIVCEEFEVLYKYS